MIDEMADGAAEAFGLLLLPFILLFILVWEVLYFGYQTAALFGRWLCGRE